MSWLTPDLAPSFVLVGGWLLFIRSFRFAGYALAAMTLLATILHEAAHYLCGKVLGAKPVSVSLWPQRRGNYWVMGSVGFTNINVWNAAFVAFAPLMLLPLGIAVFNHGTVPALANGALLWWFVSGYLVACCLYGSLPSVTDIKVGAGSALMYGSLGYVLWQNLSSATAG